MCVEVTKWLGQDLSWSKGRVDSFNKYLSRTTAGKALPLGHKERIKISFLSLGGIGVSRKVYSFPMAAVTNYDKFGGLKQHRSILSHSFGGQTYEMGLTGLKSRCQQGCIPSGSSAEESVSCLFQLLEASVFLGLLVPFHFQSQHWPVESFSSCITLTPFCCYISFSASSFPNTLMITLGSPA